MNCIKLTCMFILITMLITGNELVSFFSCKFSSQVKGTCRNILFIRIRSYEAINILYPVGNYLSNVSKVTSEQCPKGHCSGVTLTGQRDIALV